MSDSVTLMGESIGGNHELAKRVKTRDKRICAHDGCDTVLSVYNLNKKCAQHQEAQVIRIRGYTIF